MSIERIGQLLVLPRVDGSNFTVHPDAIISVSVLGHNKDQCVVKEKGSTYMHYITATQTEVEDALRDHYEDEKSRR